VAFGGVEAVPSSRGSKEWSRAGVAEGSGRVVFYADCRCHQQHTRAEPRAGAALAGPPPAGVDAGSTVGIFLLCGLRGGDVRLVLKTW